MRKEANCKFFKAIKNLIIVSETSIKQQEIKFNFSRYIILRCSTSALFSTKAFFQFWKRTIFTNVVVVLLIQSLLQSLQRGGVNRYVILMQGNTLAQLFRRFSFLNEIALFCLLKLRLGHPKTRIIRLSLGFIHAHNFFNGAFFVLSIPY